MEGLPPHVTLPRVKYCRVIKRSNGRLPGVAVTVYRPAVQQRGASDAISRTLVLVQPLRVLTPPYRGMAGMTCHRQGRTDQGL